MQLDKMSRIFTGFQNDYHYFIIIFDALNAPHFTIILTITYVSFVISFYFLVSI